MDSEQMLVNWLLETLQNGSSWLLFNHNVLTKIATRNSATHECGSINEIRSIRHFHFCINQKLKYIKYSLENQFSIFFWCGSMHCVWVTRTLVWALESVLDRKSEKDVFSCWIRSRVKNGLCRSDWCSSSTMKSLIKISQEKMDQNAQQDTIHQRVHQAPHQSTPKVDLQGKEKQRRKIFYQRAQKKIPKTMKKSLSWKKIWRI